MMILFFLVLSIALLILFSLVYSTIQTGISPMPTSSKMREALFLHLPELHKGKVVDLGSGWGNLIFSLSKHYPNSQIIGYECSPIPYLFTFLFNTYSNLKIYRKNFFKISVSDADLIVCYLYSKRMGALREKLEKEVKPGAWILSHTFAISGWVPKQIIEINDLYHSKIYVYTR